MKKIALFILFTAFASPVFAGPSQYTVQILDPSGQIVASSKVGLAPEGVGHPIRLEGRTIEPNSPASSGFPILMQGNIVKVSMLPPGCWIDDQSLSQTCLDIPAMVELKK